MGAPEVVADTGVNGLTVADGVVYIYSGSFPGKVHAVDASDGSEIWSFTAGDRVESSPAVSSDGKVVYVGSMDGNLYAIKA